MSPTGLSRPGRKLARRKAKPQNWSARSAHPVVAAKMMPWASGASRVGESRRMAVGDGTWWSEFLSGAASRIEDGLHGGAWRRGIGGQHCSLLPPMGVRGSPRRSHGPASDDSKQGPDDMPI